MFRRDRGFTLVELMVTIILLAILSVVAVVSYKKYVRKARASEAIQFLGSIKMAQEQYFATYGQYVDAQWYPPRDGDGRTIDRPWDMKCPDDIARYPGWCSLGVRPNTDTVNFQYMTEGWAPGDGNPPDKYIKHPERRWWYAIARGQFDAGSDAIQAEFRLSSELTEVQMFNEAQ